ncbi:MAG: protein kinase [Sorangiineae bacterium]|nr:protein kinase [Polyangiaceae bacterium]MEB2323525.1 protein kinase [Sorangiineae bacterium]
MQASPLGALEPRIIGRYALYGELAAGGMATVHFGRLVGAAGFSRTVAIKRLHPQFARDPEFVEMFLDEARIAARIQHPNVVSTLDVVAVDGEVFLVMEYVHGEALSKLVRASRARGASVPPRIAVAGLIGALTGLHAAHEAKSERGEPLHLVHRDVSPQNVLLGVDGVARVLDFGVAKAAARVTSTRDGQVKGKVSYMAPEQLGGGDLDRRTDVFAAGIVLWEALTGQRLFDGQSPAEIINKIAETKVPPPSRVEASVPSILDAIVEKALSRDREGRFATAQAFAIALEESGAVALPREVGEWVARIGRETLDARASRIAEIEHSSSATPPATVPRGVGEGGSPPYEATAAGEPLTLPSQRSRIVAGVPPSPALAPLRSSQRGARGSPANRKLIAILLAVTGALVAAIGVFVAVLWNRPAAPAGARAVSPSPSGPADLGASPVAPATEAVVEEPRPSASTGSPTPGVAPPVELEARPAEATEPEPAEARPARPLTKPAARPRPRPAQNKCDPPIYVDPDGIRRVKPGCG